MMKDSRLAGWRCMCKYQGETHLWLGRVGKVGHCPPWALTLLRPPPPAPEILTLPGSLGRNDLITNPWAIPGPQNTSPSYNMGRNHVSFQPRQG